MNYPLESIFFKILLKNSHQFQGLKAYSTVGLVTLQLFRPSA
jgi:hypothetical protein